MPRKSTKNSLNSFETDLARLTGIVDEVDNVNTPLETAISLYKEGLALAGKCGELLRTAEAEVLVLQKNAEDMFTLEPFEGKNGRV